MNQPMNYTIDYTLQNDVIFLQKISYTDIGHKNANYLYFEVDFAMNKQIAERVVYLIVKNLRTNKIFIDFHQFKKSFLKHFAKRFFILKLDWNYELSMNQSLLITMIDQAESFRSPMNAIDRALDKMLIDIAKIK